MSFGTNLGKIFNAVVAYQEKTIEFNKRFINPWIRLGNVFDKQDRNKEAVSAYQKAIEIDPDNAQNWYELGNVHFKMGHYEDAVAAFNKAIELEPGYGWPYNNLALTLVSQGKHIQAIPLYRKSIDLLTEDKDRAVAWNRLGNVYRKLNEYALAVDAFQKADDLDHENAGFRDNLDEAAERPIVEANGAANGADTAPVNVSPIELIVADGRSSEEATTDADQPASMLDISLELIAGQQLEPEASSVRAEHQPDPALTPKSVAPEAELQAATLEPAAIAPESERAALETEPIVAAEDAAPEPVAEPALSQPEVVTEASIVEVISSTLELDSAALQPEEVVVDEADATEPVIDALLSAPEVEPVPAEEPEAVVSVEPASPESDLELTFSHDEAIASSENNALEPESDFTSQSQAIAETVATQSEPEPIAAQLEIPNAFETAAPAAELELAAEEAEPIVEAEANVALELVASEIASEFETVAADANTELTISSEESTNNNATIAQVPEPTAASEFIELAQEPIAEVTAIFPETAAPVQVLETPERRTDHYCRSKHRSTRCPITYRTNRFGRGPEHSRDIYRNPDCYRYIHRNHRRCADD